MPSTDQLISINGNTFAYDNVGNATTWNGKYATYSKGRQLQSFDGVVFGYNNLGQRTSKEDISFVYDNNGNLVKQSNGFEFLYNGSGVLGFVYDNENYIYRKNAQGDVIAILDKTGSLVVKYNYDSWGNCTVLSDLTDFELSELNPFRYRSYYYDTETGLYFLKTRYYDPETCRFITIDDISYLDPESINGLNLYAYCNNNPVMYTDSTGTSWNSFWNGVGNFFSNPIVQIITTAVVIVGLGIATALTGGAAGVILGAAFWGATTGALGGAVIGGIAGVITGLSTGDWSGMLGSITGGMMSGAISGAISGAALSGIRIATGAVKIVGTAQKTGSIFHRFASNVQAGKMSMLIGKNPYSEIHLNRSKGLGIGRLRPDVTGVSSRGLKIVEVVSSTQTYASQVNKVNSMINRFSQIYSGMTIDGLRLLINWFNF